MSRAIDTDMLSASYRAKAVRVPERKLLITRFTNSSQVNDLELPPNCDGFGRIRHFRRSASTSGWPTNPLPIDPAVRRLNLHPGELMLAQIFQNAVCNWRCWYCFVPFDLLSANPKHSAWVTAGQLIDLYLRERERAPMIDLSGGQPDLVPEWVPWTMEALIERGLEKSVFLWSDDNLSNDYFWRYLTKEQIELIRSYPMYSKVCCFKGFDGESFAFNTKAESALFNQQFELFRRYLDLGLDLYAYGTFTAATAEGVKAKMATFVDQLQAVHPNLPLRTIPLEIRPFSVVEARKFPHQAAAIVAQQAAIDAWRSELEQRYSPAERSLPIVDVRLAR